MNVRARVETAATRAIAGRSDVSPRHLLNGAAQGAATTETRTGTEIKAGASEGAATGTAFATGGAYASGTSTGAAAGTALSLGATKGAETDIDDAPITVALVL